MTKWKSCNFCCIIKMKVVLRKSTHVIKLWVTLGAFSCDTSFTWRMPDEIQLQYLADTFSKMDEVSLSLQWNKTDNICSVQFRRSVVSDSLQPHESQLTRPPCPSPTPGDYSNSCPLSRWCPQPSHPLSSPSPPAPNPSQHQGLFQRVNSSYEVAKVLGFQLQHESF